MFRVEAVSSPRGDLKFGRKRNGQNKICVLTGPNGSGKTELLTTLARWFSSPNIGGLQQGVSIRWYKDGTAYVSEDHDVRHGPTRVIAQTFSPFSRFSAPHGTHLSLTKIYAEAIEEHSNYRCVGIHRRTHNIGGALSKRVLEQGIFHLTEAPVHARNLGKVLRALGFRERLDFRYRGSATAKALFNAFHRDELQTYISYMLPHDGGRANAELRKELRRTGSAPLVQLLHGALELLGEYPDKGAFEFSFDFEAGRASEDFAKMQALVLLRRLDVLGLERCSLSPLWGQKSIDLAEASSGQQQMLCSMFGLSSELRDNSLVLIDEPELSLHPTWQMAFLDRLNAILDQFDGCHVILATHSPLIAQGALMNDIEVLQMQSPFDGSTADASLQHNSDASVEETLLDIFGTPVPGSVYLANQIFAIVTEGESGGQQKREIALSHLDRLRRLYSRGENGSSNRHDLEIIQKATRLLLQPDVTPDEDLSDA
ncbi:AAA family ATPase [Paraburkholderia atlantica]|uniref:AAA family ATPase n=1 Tax=Paraburkholderia atlantica TaxID=2654982 RepID=UPI00039B1B68|nr:AAA family ATPase [Paraburkholderia atlantica]